MPPAFAPLRIRIRTRVRVRVCSLKNVNNTKAESRGKKSQGKRHGPQHRGATAQNPRQLPGQDPEGQREVGALNTLGISLARVRWHGSVAATPSVNATGSESQVGRRMHALRGVPFKAAGCHSRRRGAIQGDQRSGRGAKRAWAYRHALGGRPAQQHHVLVTESRQWTSRLSLVLCVPALALVAATAC